MTEPNKRAELVWAQSSEHKWQDDAEKIHHTGHDTSPRGVTVKIFARFLRPFTLFLAAAIPWLIYIFLLCPVLGHAADSTGGVVGVLDGDTLEVLNGHHTKRIRLSGIDCPEKGQAFGKRAKQAASELVYGKEVMLQTHGYDKYNRTIGDVFLLDGTRVNHELVKQGWCWWYRSMRRGIRCWKG